MDIAAGIRRLVAARNRGLTFEAFVEFWLGVLFTALTLGFIYWIAWVFTYFTSLQGYFPAIVTGLFALASFYEAWRRVNPLQGVRSLTDAEMRLTLIALATPHFAYFSPRHALAGWAMVVLGGPANIFASIATLMHRLPSGGALFECAADLLSRALDGVPIDRVENLRAAYLLQRLALIKSIAVCGSENDTITTTQKGRDLLAGRKVDP